MSRKALVSGDAPLSFIDPGPLIDHELELIQPGRRWVGAVLRACRHPLTIRDAPEDASTTRQRLLGFLAAAPRGLQPGDPATGRVPQYHFWMRLRGSLFRPPPVKIAGGITLRIGCSAEVERLYGHIGYHVYPPARGRHYAERACRLLLPLCRCHRIRTLWITCNPDNSASRQTCQRLGMEYAGTVTVPPDSPLYERGDREKCRYRMEL